MNHVKVIVPDIPCQKAARTGVASVLVRVCPPAFRSGTSGLFWDRRSVRFDAMLVLPVG